MEVTTTEIAPDVFRLSATPPGAPVSFGCFVIRDEQPAMVETGMRQMFPLFREAVASLVDPASLRYFIVPHFEMDECGSINEFLAEAPDAQVICSPVGAAVTIPDYIGVAPRAVAHEETLSLGRKSLRMVLAPWVHYWDSLVVYDETDRLLFSSDLFMQTGDREPCTSEDRSDEVRECARFFGLLPSQAHLNQLLDRIAPLPIDTLACHHGSVLQGDPARYYKAMRDHAADVVDAPFYEMQGVAGP
jgi:flavorubredoxin